MAKKNEFKERLSQLGNKIKDEPVTTPIQEVRPVEPATIPSLPATVKKESHVNFWVPDSLMERLKIHAVRSKKTIKQLGVEALEEYLNKRNA